MGSCAMRILRPALQAVLLFLLVGAVIGIRSL